MAPSKSTFPYYREAMPASFYAPMATSFMTLKSPTRENFTSAATTPMPALRMSSLSPEPLAAPSHPTTPYSSSPGVGISNSLSMAPSSKKFRTLLIAAGRSALLQEPSLPQRAPMPASPTSQSTALHSTTLPGQPLTVRRGEGCMSYPHRRGSSKLLMMQGRVELIANPEYRLAQV